MTKAKLRLIRIVRIVLAGSALLFTVQNASAFKVFTLFGVLTGIAIHEDITRQALAQVSSTLAFTKGVIHFSEAATLEIQAENRWTDSVNLTDPHYHFDNEQFAAANTLLIQATNDIVALAKARDYVGARKRLGTALHTLQDFYAHSTWIESFGGNAVENTALGTASFSMSPSAAPTCSQFSVIPGSPYTSGYFTTATTLMQVVGVQSHWTNTFYPQIPVLDRCIHGSDQPSGSDLGGGINKDNPGRAFHAEARQAAIMSSRTYVSRIVRLLEADKQDRAICGLFGQEDSTACRNVPSTITWTGNYIFLPPCNGVPSTATYTFHLRPMHELLPLANKWMLYGFSPNPYVLDVPGVSPNLPYGTNGTVRFVFTETHGQFTVSTGCLRITASFAPLVPTVSNVSVRDVPTNVTKSP